jgi:Carboxypeptidase regulatory-like domain
MESGAGTMKVTRKRSNLIAGFALAAVCLLVPAMTQAQELRGKITGRVTDPSGAVIPGATVKVTDVARATTSTLITNEEGLFDAPYLVPGTYQVVVELAGFKKALEDNVQVAINDTRILNIKLDVGAATDTVTVTDTASPLATADADLGNTIDRKRVDELPSVHGDPYALMHLTPGLTYTGSTRLDRPFEPTHIVGYAVAGTRGNRSDLLIDGAPSTATANGNEVIASYVPPTDITQEFKVQTATYDAQFGNTEGGVTSIAIKSGTNNLHGTGYIWTEPGGMAANDFFGNARGQARPFSYSNRPGFSVNGPVYLPGIYDGRNKTFFLFSYEGIRDSRPRFDATNIWVPTDALKNGNFSAYSSNITIYDPLTGTFSNGTVTNRTAFANNIIPADRINPVAKAMLSAFGSPKDPTVLTGNINDSTLAEKTRKYDNYTTRIDQNFGARDRFFWRYSQYTRDSSYNNYTGTSYIGDRFGFLSKQTVLDEVHTFNGSTILNVGYGFNRFSRVTDAPEGQYGMDLTTLGFPSSYNSLVSEGIRRFPRLDFTCTSCTGATLGNGHTNENRPVDSHSFKAVLNWTHSKHSVKVGSDMRIYREDDSFKSNNQTGQFSFDNTYTRVGSASSADYQGLQAFASFLLGYPSTMALVRAADYSEYSKTWGFFGQDDFRLSQKLTLNLGLRWEFETPLTERQNKSVSGFDTSYTQPIEAAAQANYAALADTFLKTTAGLSQINVKGGLLFAGKDTGRGLYNTPKNGFLPRLGFAYQLNDKTSVRGGFGLFQGFLGERRGDVLQSGYSQTTTTPVTTGPNGAPLPVLLSTPFLNTAIIEPTGNTLGKQTGLGQTITFFEQNPKVSKQARFSLGFQREVRGWFFEANYVGDHGYDIEITRNVNAVPNKFLNTDGSRTQAMQDANTNLTGTVANPFRGGLIPNASGTISRQSLLIAYPEFGTTLNTTNNDGSSWYHSGQFSVSRRFTRGFGIQWSYTRSKWIQQTEYLNAGDDKPTKMISDQDVPNRFTTSGFYELPFGKGKVFGNNVNRLVNTIIGGWQIEGTYSLQSGFPVAFANDAFLTGASISIPKDQQTVNHWFNTDAFVSVITANAAAPTCGAFPTGSANCASPTSHVRTLPLRFSNVRLDGINNADLGIRKDIALDGEASKKIQLRMEFINAFNNPLLPGPVVNPSSKGTAIPGVCDNTPAKPCPGDFGTINYLNTSNQLNYARRAQLSAKFIF